MQSNKRQKTIADVFCDTYIEMDPEPRRGGYLSIAKILQNKRYFDDPTLLFEQHAKPCVFDRDGFPVHRIRTRFERALRKCGDNICRLRNLLAEVFNDNAIKFLFPDIWIMNNNCMARKRRATEVNEINRQKKLDREGFQTKIEVSRITANKSVSRFVRDMRSLALSK